MKRSFQTVLLALWIVIIFILTGYPSLEAPKIKGLPVDKLYHFLIFIVLGLLQMPLLRTKHFFLLGFSIAIVAEFQQIFIPGRDFEFLDMLAGFLGLFAIYIVLRLRNRAKKAQKGKGVYDLSKT